MLLSQNPFPEDNDVMRDVLSKSSWQQVRPDDNNDIYDVYEVYPPGGLIGEYEEIQK